MMERGWDGQLRRWPVPVALPRRPRSSVRRTPPARTRDATGTRRVAGWRNRHVGSSTLTRPERPARVTEPGGPRLRRGEDTWTSTRGANWIISRLAARGPHGHRPAQPEATTGSRELGERRRCADAQKEKLFASGSPSGASKDESSRPKRQVSRAPKLHCTGGGHERTKTPPAPASRRREESLPSRSLSSSLPVAARAWSSNAAIPPPIFPGQPESADGTGREGHRLHILPHQPTHGQEHECGLLPHEPLREAPCLPERCSCHLSCHRHHSVLRQTCGAFKW
ncbi:hypothetical protein SEVIR_7G110900v4 [Setaria viridis]